VERTTRFTMLLHLPRMAEHGVDARVKNGPALAGMALRQSATASRARSQLAGAAPTVADLGSGAEMSQHARLKIDTGLDVYFCDPHSRGSAARTKIPMGCCGSIFRKAPT